MISAGTALLSIPELWQCTPARALLHTHQRQQAVPLHSSKPKPNSDCWDEEEIFVVDILLHNYCRSHLLSFEYYSRYKGQADVLLLVLSSDALGLTAY